MKAVGAIVKLGWGDNYFFNKLEDAQEMIRLLSIGHRVDGDWIDGKSYIVEKQPNEPTLVLAYKAPITEDAAKELRLETEIRKANQNPIDAQAEEEN